MSPATILDAIEPAELARCLFEESRDALFVFDPRDMSLVDVNPRAVEFTRLPRHQLLERGLIELFDAEDGQRLNEFIGACGRTQKFHSPQTYTYLLRRKSEASLPVGVTVDRLRAAPEPLGIVMVREKSERIQTHNEQREQAKEQFQASDVRYRSLVENAPVCIHEIDLSGRLASMNPAGLKMISVDDVSQVVGHELLSFVADHDRERVENLLKQAFQGHPSSFEFTCPVQGDPRLFSSNFIPIVGDDGAVKSLIGTTQDITESQQVMHRLRIQELAINSVETGVTIIDAAKDDAPIVHCNPAFERMTGYSREEVIGKNCRFLQAGDTDQDGVRSIYKAIAQERECTAVVRNYRKDGSMFWNEVSIAPLHDQSGKTSHFVGFQKDVTERIEMQGKLLESESRFRSIFEQAAVGVALIETDTGRFVRINQKYSQLIGYSQGEMAQRTFIDITFPEDLRADMENMRRLHAGEISEFAMEKRLIHKNGSMVWVRLTVSPTWQPGEEPHFHVAIVEDITRRKEAEQAMQRSEHKFRTLCKHAPMGIFLTDVDGKFNYMNETGCTIMGQSTDASSVGSGWANALHVDDRRRVMEAWATCVETTRLFDVETRLRHPGGKVVWARARANARCDDDGEIVGYVGTLVDITQSKNTMQELMQWAHRCRSLIENAPEVIVVLDVDSGRFVDFNERAVTIFKSAPETILASGPWDFSPEYQPDGRKSSEAAKELISRAVAGETVDCEWLHCDAEGREIPCDLRLTRFPDDRGRLVRGSITDITQRKRAQQQLLMTRFAVESTDDAMFVIDCQGRFVDVNEIACTRLGYDREDLLRMDVSDINPLFPLDRWEEHWNDIKQHGKLIFESEHAKRDGSKFPVEVSKSYFEFEGNEYAFAFVRDITHRKQIEEKLRQRENQLAHVSRLYTMGEMVAGIAHEVNQPLYSIVNFSKAINNTLKQSTDCNFHQIAEWNQQIRTAANRAGQIIKRLRGFVSRQPTHRTSVNLYALITDAIEFVHYESNRCGVTLDLALLDKAVEVCVDRVQTQQVLVNLLVNAIEAMDGNTPAERRISISVSVGMDQVEISVADRGIGLPEQSKNSIFDVFVSTKPSGMGMGLAISKTIIDSFGGRLWATNNERGGATFYFTLPRVSGGSANVS